MRKAKVFELHNMVLLALPGFSANKAGTDTNHKIIDVESFYDTLWRVLGKSFRGNYFIDLQSLNQLIAGRRTDFFEVCACSNIRLFHRI